MFKQLILQTSRASSKNGINSQIFFNSVHIKSLLKDNKPIYSLKLKSIRGVFENDESYTGEVTNNDLARNKTFNIYLKGLWFNSYPLKQEVLLSTFQIDLPKQTTFNLECRNIISGVWRINAPTTDPFVMYLLNNPKFDTQWRIMVISSANTPFRNSYLNKRATFTTLFKVGGADVYELRGMTFDDTITSPIDTLSPSPFFDFSIVLFEWYSSFEAMDLDHKYLHEMSFEKPTQDFANLSLEYRDLETNQIISSTNTSGESYPDLTFMFDIE